MSDQPKQVPITIHCDAPTALGAYVNVTLIHHTDNEFILDHAFAPPQVQADGQRHAQVRSRVVCTPRHAKKLLQALQQNVGQYEQIFGQIDEAAVGEVVFQGPSGN